MSSPTSRTLAALRKDGYLAAVVERWIPQVRQRKDLFEVVDVLAIKDGITLAVQATSYSNVSARVRKIADAPATPIIRSAGWRFEVHGWKKNKAGRWECRVVDVS